MSDKFEVKEVELDEVGCVRRIVFADRPYADDATAEEYVTFLATLITGFENAVVGEMKISPEECAIDRVRASDEIIVERMHELAHVLASRAKTQEESALAAEQRGDVARALGLRGSAMSNKLVALDIRKILASLGW